MVYIATVRDKLNRLQDLIIVVGEAFPGPVLLVELAAVVVSLLLQMVEVDFSADLARRRHLSVSYVHL